jgi:hypothetical protein
MACWALLRFCFCRGLGRGLEVKPLSLWCRRFAEPWPLAVYTRQGQAGGRFLGLPFLSPHVLPEMSAAVHGLTQAVRDDNHGVCCGHKRGVRLGLRYTIRPNAHQRLTT